MFEVMVDAQGDEGEGGAALEADIAALNITIVDLRGDITDKNGQITALTGHQVGLETALANAKTDAERVPLLVNLVSDWTSKFSLADSKCKDYEGVIFSMTGVIHDKDVVISTWREQYLAQVDIVTSGDKALSSVRADLRRAKFWGTIKSGVVLALVAEVLYKIVLKK